MSVVLLGSLCVLLVVFRAGLHVLDWLLSIPVLTGGGDGKTSLWVDQGFLSVLDWLLSVPVLAGSSDGEASFGVDQGLGSNKSCARKQSSFHYIIKLTN